MSSRISSLGAKHYERKTKLSQLKSSANNKGFIKIWLQERILRVYFILISIYILINIFMGHFKSSATLLQWIGNPFHFTLLVISIIISTRYFISVIKEALEDYVHNVFAKIVAMFVINSVFYFLAAFCLVGLFFIFKL